MTYYNEIDPKCCEWLRQLMDSGLIAAGTIDPRSIKDVTPADLAGVRRAHFFAGIAGWDYALQLAGWPSDRPVWTGSCPCQPYSAAGKRKGNADERNLWPDFYRLIRECRPDTIFGEQVEGAIGHGWLDGVQADLEREGYAVGHCVLCAAGVGAPHIRSRLYWMAHTQCPQRGTDGIADATTRGRQQEAAQPGGVCDAGGLAHAQCDGRRIDEQGAGQEGRAADRRSGPGAYGLGNSSACGRSREDGTGVAEQGSWSGRHWDSHTIANCIDGKRRRIPAEPAFFPLAHGTPGRVAQLRGLGNCIVPQVAATFIRAFLDTEGLT